MRFGNITIGGMSLGSTRIGGAKLGNTLVYQSGGSPAYKRLPDGYTELAYVGTDSHAFVGTGVSGATDLEIIVRFSIETYVQYAAIYGNYIDESYNYNRAILASSTSLYVAGGSNQSQAVTNFSTYQLHTLSVKSTEAYLEGTKTSVTAAQKTANTKEICLGNRCTDNPSFRDTGLRIFAFCIKKAGSVILNYVPCKRDSDSFVGFYDLASNSFVYSLTGTSFTAGPAAVYSGRMLKCLSWAGTNDPYASNWYEPIAHQYWTLSNATHGSDYYEFANSTPSSVSQYATLSGKLPDLGNHWKIVVDLAVRMQSNNPSIFCPIDFGSMGTTANNTCATGITLNSSGYWGVSSKFNGNSSSSTYSGAGDYHIDAETISTSLVWVRRTVEIGVRASSTTGKDETYIAVYGKGYAKSSTPYTPVRFNRWNTPMYIARSLTNPSSSYPYATSARIYSIDVYYEPFIV